MKTKIYYKNSELCVGLEVTGKEALELKKEYPISISKVDLEHIESNPNKIIGTIFGDLEAINNNEWKYKTPDLWLVYKPKKHGYKDLTISKFTFGEAIELMKLGFKLAREGWNGKNMWLIYVPGSKVTVRENTPYLEAGLRGEIQIDGHIDMCTAKGTIQPGWLASQADMLSSDWITKSLFIK